MNEKVTKNCLYCKTPFQLYQSKKDRLFCSRTCFGNSKKCKPSWNAGTKSYTDINCINCTTVFNAETYRKQKFCSHLCALIFNGKQRLGVKFSEARKKTLRNTHPHLTGERSPNWKGGFNKNITRRSRKANASGTHTIEQWHELKQKFNFMCLCCKQQEPFIKLSEDHIVPLSRGGSNDISNIQPLCKSCNCRKHTKTIDYRTSLIQII